jgi:CRP/FNR family cyclic AMP-dependent transcriptional regulator
MSVASRPEPYSTASLRQFDLLRHCSEEQLRTALAASRCVRYQKGDTVVSKGRDLDVLGFLLQGKLQVVDFLSDGTEFGLNLIESGHFFGELAVIDRMPRSASVVALVPSVIIQMPGETARWLIYGNPPVAEAMMRHLAQAVRRMTELRALQAIPHAHKRVYALLEHLKRRSSSDMHVIEHMPTHITMAIMVNTSRETVTRALARLKAEGVIQKDMRRLIIRRPDHLRYLIESHDPHEA